MSEEENENGKGGNNNNKNNDKNNNNNGEIDIKCWRCIAGSLTNLKLCHEKLLLPKSGELRIKVKAIGLNFADIFAILGLYSATPVGEFIPGLEFSGIIESIGVDCEKETDFQIGDQVMGFTRFGAYTSYVNVSHYFVKRIPNGWNFGEAASFLIQGITAWHAMIELGNIKMKPKPNVNTKKKKPLVLVHSAAGGVGQIAMDFCEILNCIPIATIGNPEKKQFLIDRFKIPEEQIIIRDERNFGEQCVQTLKYVERDGFDIVLDALGGVFFTEGYKHMDRGGRMITFGAATFMSTSNRPNWFKIVPRYLTRPKIDPQQMCSDNKSVMGFNLIWLTDKVDDLTEELNDMLSYSEKIRAPFVGTTFAFEDIKSAISKLQSGLSLGKVVVFVEDEEDNEKVEQPNRKKQKTFK